MPAHNFLVQVIMLPLVMSGQEHTRVGLAFISEQRRMQRLSKSTKELYILISDCNRITYCYAFIYSGGIDSKIPPKIWQVPHLGTVSKDKVSVH